MSKVSEKDFEKQFEEHIEKKVEEKFGKAWEDRVEKQVEERVKKAFKPKGPAARRVGYVFSIAFNILFLWIANNLLNWQVQWITREWADVLTLVNISAIANVVVYSMFLFYDKRTFYYVARIVLDIIAIVVSVQMIRVFPFAFEHLWGWSWLNSVGPWLMVLGIVGVVVAFSIRTSKFCRGKNIYD